MSAVKEKTEEESGNNAPVSGGGASRIKSHTFTVSETENNNNLYPPVSFNETMIPDPHISVKRYPEKKGLFRVFSPIFFRTVKNGGKVLLAGNDCPLITQIAPNGDTDYARHVLLIRRTFG
jgi:hypothetical protein